MATNNLRPEEDLQTRAFFRMVQRSNYLSNSPAHRRQLMAILLEALNYDQVGPDLFVEKGQTLQVPFGKTASDVYENEWNADEERAKAALGRARSDDASTSEPSESN